jgi:predicted transcriptional regulator
MPKRLTRLIPLPPRRTGRAVISTTRRLPSYIELHAYQDALVRKGLEEMRKGRVVSQEEVVKRLKQTGRASPVVEPIVR